MSRIIEEETNSIYSSRSRDSYIQQQRLQEQLSKEYSDISIPSRICQMTTPLKNGNVDKFSDDVFKQVLFYKFLKFFC